MAVAFQELDNSPRFTVNRDGFSGTRRFLVAWANVKAFCIELVGNAGLGAAGVSASSPAAFPGWTNVFCSNVEVTPFNAEKPTAATPTDHTTEINTYDDALVVASYQTLPAVSGGAGGGGSSSDPTPPSGTIVEWSRRHSGDFLTVPSRSFQWVDAGGNQPIMEDVHPGILIPTTDFTATWHFVKKPPDEAISRLKGQINQAVFHGKAAETLLFNGAEDSVSIDLNGEQVTRLTYTFTEKTVVDLAGTGEVYSGWTHYLREPNPLVSWTVANWCKITPSPHVSGDFNELFQLGT